MASRKSARPTGPARDVIEGITGDKGDELVIAAYDRLCAMVKSPTTVWEWLRCYKRQPRTVNRALRRRAAMLTP